MNCKKSLLNFTMERGYFKPGRSHTLIGGRFGTPRVAKRREELRDWQADQERRSKALEAQLEDVPEVDVAGWRDAKRRFTEQRDRFHARVARNETLLERLREERHRELRRSQNLADRQKKGALVRAQLTVTQDVHSVLTKAYERMRGEELRKVSNRMNGIFLEMIGSDPEQRAIIRSTTINEQFDKFLILLAWPDDLMNSSTNWFP